MSEQDEAGDDRSDSKGRANVVKAEDGTYAARVRDSYGGDRHLLFNSAQECEATIRELRDAFEEAESR